MGQTTVAASTPDDEPRGQAVAALRAAAEAGRGALDEPTAKAILAAFGVPVPAGAMIAGVEDAAACAASLGFPLAIKLVSPHAIHKSDVGGVQLGVRDAAAAREAVLALGRKAIEHGVETTGFLLERMAAPGAELVIGGVNDPRFGPVVMVGFGGVFVEIFADTAFRVCPIDRATARQMLDELMAVPLLRGARGRRPLREDAVIGALLAIGGADGLLMSAADVIAELDINPLIVSEESAIACDARIVLRSAAGDERAPRASYSLRTDADLLASFRPLFEPRVVAVIGASGSAFTQGNEFIRQSLALGFAGRMIPVHPKADMVEGLPTVRSLADIDGQVDYAYVAIAAEQIPELIASMGGKVRFAQIVSSGFAEIAGGVELENRLAAEARRAGVRVLGPNCLGLYSPRGGIAFLGDCPGDAGSIGIVTQSGGLSIDMILRGKTRGLRFSAVVTVGNSVDVGPAELLEYYLADPNTRAIGLYIEDVKDGRRFFEVLHAAAGRKPIVLLLGGQTQQGQQAAASHTGSLASAVALWNGMARQTGLVITETLEQYLDSLVAFQNLEPRRDGVTRRCVLFGNGGGTSVLAADAFARRDLDVEPMVEKAVAELAALNLPPGTSIVNPVDAPGFTLRQDGGRVAESILEIIYQHAEPDAVVLHLNLPVFVKSADQSVDVLANLLAAAMRVRARHPARAHFVLVLRSDGSPECEARKREFRAGAAELGVPTFDEMVNAADALKAVATHEAFVTRAQTSRTELRRASPAHPSADG